MDRLKDAGIRTFRDDEELHVGKEIGRDLLRAIEESTISVPIISKGYASSKWCLIELTHMLKCRKNTGHVVWPIFYDVMLSDCKHRTGTFAAAFVQHMKDEGTKERAQEWKEALEEVAKTKGWEKDKVADGYEGELVNIVASEICMKLKRNNVNLTDILVGMGHHEEQMTELLLDNDGSGVRIVGIQGMGGIGKTTIAKFMYNKLWDHFQHQCSFLEDIREKVRRNGYGGLRNQLISDILKRKADGITLDRNTLRTKTAVERHNLREQGGFLMMKSKNAPAISLELMRLGSEAMERFVGEYSLMEK